MTESLTGGQNAAKPLRRDAQRNREHLIATARELFSAGELDLRMEEIAKRAGVGVGTLYRHFATRKALTTAVYRQEVETLCAAAPELLTSLPADEALAAFLYRFTAHVASNPGLATALGTLLGQPAPEAELSKMGPPEPDVMLAAITLLMTAAATADLLRPDIAPGTVLLVLCGLCTAQNQPDWEAGARAVVGLLLDGLKIKNTAPSTLEP